MPCILGFETITEDDLEESATNIYAYRSPNPVQDIEIVVTSNISNGISDYDANNETQNYLCNMPEKYIENQEWQEIQSRNINISTNSQYLQPDAYVTLEIR